MSEYVLELPDAGEALSVIAAATPDQGQHLARALERLAEQFKGRPKIEALITALMTAFQDLENVFQQVLLERTIDAATGVQLDMLGVIVGQPRESFADEDYRRLIRARIAVHRSAGRFEDLIRISKLVVADDNVVYTVRNEGTATVVVTLASDAVTDAVANLLVLFLRKSKAGGVKLWLRYSSSSPATTFTLDSGPGLDVGHLATELE